MVEETSRQRETRLRRERTTAIVGAAYEIPVQMSTIGPTSGQGPGVLVGTVQNHDPREAYAAQKAEAWRKRAGPGPDGGFQGGYVLGGAAVQKLREGGLMAEQPVYVEGTHIDPLDEVVSIPSFTLLADEQRKPILVIAAHADDEALGCGGTIIRAVAQGFPVHVVIMTDGGTDVRGYQRERKPRSVQDMGIEIDSVSASPGWRNGHKAAKMMGVQTVCIHDLPDSKFDMVPVLELAQIVERHLDLVRPAIVLTHFSGDLNQDHRRVAEAAIMACRPKPNHPVQHLLFYEIASSTEWHVPSSFQPNLYIDITDQQDAKELVLKEAYGREMRESVHPRSIPGVYALNSWRGATIGVEVAEAFMVGRSIIR